MTRISYHASHEQFSPRDLLVLAARAEAAGFDAVFSSDHFHPWSREQGHSGFTWAWLGAALQATSRVTFGAITIPGGWRYHPAITAQAVATLAQMFPGRLPWIAVGSGESLNEHVVGLQWPARSERNERLAAAVGIIRELFEGRRVTREQPIAVRDAQLWDLPAEPVRLMAAALTPETAEWAGAWADGLLTLGTNLESSRRLVQAFRVHGARKPLHAKVDLCWAPTEEEALHQAWEQWRVHAIDRRGLAEFSTPEEFETAACNVRPDDMRACVLISADPAQHVRWLRERMALGFDTLDLHNVGMHQQEFIDVFGRHVLPALRD